MPCFAGEVPSRLPLTEPRVIFLNSLCLGLCSLCVLKTTTREAERVPVYTWDAVEICEASMN
jgi:hypothetical protein